MPNFPDDVVEIEFCLRQIYSIVKRRGRSLLEQYGITPPQFDALVILNRDGELTIGDLSNRLYLAYSTTTDLVDRLERADFVVRMRDSEDRRVVRVQLKAHGAELIERVLDARRAYLGSVLQAVSAEEKSRILEVLELLNRRMSEEVQFKG
ncbi:MarR family winged helix-turn-helix transcriptional regulator [Alicyclobacillus tolerans]|uniref:Transcriptional regulator, MarR family n=2 Tax=Alicyclobacillus tolerans TaxID=90970 RepID=A0A1M6MIL2_9BACL|nr:MULTISPECIES: MarR family transcriptional regulator [Alicyclobacillus]MDP9728195.1 DNA-binding MarR family transcriptional regulator [Alicyclobacillus tengchongensis]QRF23417.1 MarR family transcriptional regulator [Alicyclobacillus sp. TC]SHJ83325.1 transcriptional regulator, MarR family [Alicyclobacillus montanus]